MRSSDGRKYDVRRTHRTGRYSGARAGNVDALHSGGPGTLRSRNAPSVWSAAPESHSACGRLGLSYGTPAHAVGCNACAAIDSVRVVVHLSTSRGAGTLGDRA